MNTKQKLFGALEDLLAAGQNNFARDLQALMRRMYPADRQKIAEIMHPGRFKRADTSGSHAKEIERKTYVYPSSKEVLPAVITTSAKTAEAAPAPASTPPAKKKAVAAAQTRFPDKQAQSFDADGQEDGEEGSMPELINIPTSDGSVKPMTAGQLLAMKDDEIVALFGTLKELKVYLADVMQAGVSRNASTQTAVSAFKEQLELYR